MAHAAAPSRTSAFGLLAQARAVLTDAGAATDPGERFRLAHLSALRTAAAVSADRGRPTATRRRLISVWVLLERVAPEHADWATYFAAGAPIRAAVEAGVRSAASDRVADDQLRAAGDFLGVVERSLGLLAA
jgi:SAV_6107-like HEPN